MTKACLKPEILSFGWPINAWTSFSWFSLATVTRPTVPYIGIPPFDRGNASRKPFESPAASEHPPATVREEPRQQDQDHGARDGPQPRVAVHRVRTHDQAADPEAEESSAQADHERPEEPHGIAPRHEQSGDRPHDEPGDHDPDDGANSHVCSLPGRSLLLYPG